METDVGKLDYYAGVTGGGFSTIKVNDIKPEEFIRMPTDLLQIVEDDVGSELLILVSRERSEPLDPIRSDPEEMISRSFSIPWEREFELSGKVRLSTDVHSAKIDGLLGIDRIRLLSGLDSHCHDQHQERRGQRGRENTRKEWWRPRIEM